VPMDVSRREAVASGVHRLPKAVSNGTSLGNPTRNQNPTAMRDRWD